MILFNKTMMCGGLVILSPGSPIQVLFAILIMQMHLLFLLKLAPYIKDSEDWSSFLSTLGLCLISLGAYSMKLQLKEQEMKTIELITTILPCLCIIIVIGITLFVDFGLKQKFCGSSTSSLSSSTGGSNSNSPTKVLPMTNDANKRDGDDRHSVMKGNMQGNNDTTKIAADDLRSWGREAKDSSNNARNEDAGKKALEK